MEESEGPLRPPPHLPQSTALDAGWVAVPSISAAAAREEARKVGRVFMDDDDRADRVVVVMFAEPTPGWVSDVAYGPLTAADAHALAMRASKDGAVYTQEYPLHPAGPAAGSVASINAGVFASAMQQPVNIWPTSQQPATTVVVAAVCGRCGGRW